MIVESAGGGFIGWVFLALSLIPLVGFFKGWASFTEPEERFPRLRYLDPLFNHPLRQLAMFTRALLIFGVLFWLSTLWD